MPGTRRRTWSRSAQGLDQPAQHEPLAGNGQRHLRDAHGRTLELPGPHLAVEELVPLIPAHAYRPVTVGEPTYRCFTLAVRIPGVGKVRLVVSSEQASWTGRSVVRVTNRPDWSAAQIISL